MKRLLLAPLLIASLLISDSALATRNKLKKQKIEIFFSIVCNHIRVCLAVCQSLIVLMCVCVCGFVCLRGCVVSSR